MWSREKDNKKTGGGSGRVLQVWEERVSQKK